LIDYSESHESNSNVGISWSLTGHCKPAVRNERVS
jgi:hypothetical protein